MYLTHTSLSLSLSLVTSTLVFNDWYVCLHVMLLTSPDWIDLSTWDIYRSEWQFLVITQPCSVSIFYSFVHFSRFFSLPVVAINIVSFPFHPHRSFSVVMHACLLNEDICVFVRSTLCFSSSNKALSNAFQVCLCVCVYMQGLFAAT